ncbi:MAG: nicotinate (nicotinamide) nucleotide adenylyltransferase [Acidobacteriota bacterium]
MSDHLRIGLCGGTFDPFHLGHTRPVLDSWDAMGWDRVTYIPVFQQPFKVGLHQSSAFHRYAMTVLGTESDSRMNVSIVELEREEISFTVDTLSLFRREFPDAVIDWIIGDDNVAALPAWKNWERLFELANFVVLSRSDARPEVPEVLSGLVVAPEARLRRGALVFASNETMKVSSTEVRSRIARGLDSGDLLDPRVARYVLAHGLYRTEVDC